MKYANREWFYNYRKLFGFCPEKNIASVASSILKQYSNLTKNWTVDRNSEWTCRTYLATKMILNATVLVNSLKFSKTTGMRAANPYFEYYATLSLLRAVVYMLPRAAWADGKLMMISHSKAIHQAFELLATFDKAYASTLKNTTHQLKAQRELISYKAPASGDSNLGDTYDLIELLTILAEMAQFNSELLEASVTKNSAKGNHLVKDDHIDQLATVTIEGFDFSDSEDLRRLHYLQRKQSRPYNLASFMTEGQTEDFIGAWDGNDDDRESFSNGSPSDWQAIFDIP